ncbi:MAG: histidinol-phosphatase HisJ family protein [Elusimicrobiota bacterium]|jgi:histidinol-phosphatase (PHP family)
MATSYHNHTVLSDGRQDIAELLEAARVLKLTEVGISDHLVLHPEGKVFRWGMTYDCLGAYVREVQEAARSAEPTLRLGLEADFFPETVERLRPMLEAHPFDYVIGSVHFAGGFMVDSSREDWEKLLPEERQAKWDLYWELVRQMAESRVFDFAAHLDLPKRFGCRDSEAVSRGARSALGAIAAADMAIEINTSGWYLPAQESYPSAALLREARARSIPIVINADAHEAENLSRGFVRARELARECGYTETVRYERRRRIAVPL